MSLGKLEMDLTFEKIINAITISDLSVLQVESAYLKKIFEIPSIHKDPFDRLIIATALIENMPIITIDENIQKYDVLSIW